MPAPTPTKPPVPGIYPGIPDSEYRAWDALSQSDMKNILVSLAHYVYRKGHDKKTDAMILGSATHTCILEPDKFSGLYVAPKEKMNRRTKAGKEAWAEFEATAEADGKTVLTMDDFDTCSRMRDAVHAHPEAARLLAIPGKAEVCVRWEWGPTAIKSRLDYLADDNSIILDIKTCVSASPRAFRRAILSYKYHLQAAVYSEGVEHTANVDCPLFVFLAVEKKPPYHVAIYQLDDAMLEEGRALADDAIDAYAAGKVTGNWPGYNDGEIATISLDAQANGERNGNGNTDEEPEPAAVGYDDEYGF